MLLLYIWYSISLAGFIIIGGRRCSVLGFHSLSDWFKSSDSLPPRSPSPGKESSNLPPSPSSDRNNREIMKLQRDLKSLQVNIARICVFLMYVHTHTHHCLKSMLWFVGLELGSAVCLRRAGNTLFFLAKLLCTFKCLCNMHGQTRPVVPIFWCQNCVVKMTGSLVNCFASEFIASNALLFLFNLNSARLVSFSGFYSKVVCYYTYKTSLFTLYILNLKTWNVDIEILKPSWQNIGGKVSCAACNQINIWIQLRDSNRKVSLLGLRMKTMGISTWNRLLCYLLHCQRLLVKLKCKKVIEDIYSGKSNNKSRV